MSDSLHNLKNKIRSEFRKKRDTLTPAERFSKSSSIIDRLFNIQEIRSANSFFIYISFSSEVITHDAVRLLLQNGKTVAVPYIDIQKESMLPVQLKGFHLLEPGPMGILQPKKEGLCPVPPDTLDIIIAPGIAFSEKGWRIGYGGGFYDRFLRLYRKPVYALAFELQINRQIPFDSAYDVPVDYIITEERLIACTKNIF